MAASTGAHVDKTTGLPRSKEPLRREVKELKEKMDKEKEEEKKKKKKKEKEKEEGEESGDGDDEDDSIIHYDQVAPQLSEQHVGLLQEQVKTYLH